MEYVVDVSDYLLGRVCRTVSGTSHPADMLIPHGDKASDPSFGHLMPGVTIPSGRAYAVE